MAVQLHLAPWFFNACSWESMFFFSCPYSFIEYTKYFSTQWYRPKKNADITTRIRTNVANLSGLICSNFWHFVPYICSWKSTSCSKIPTHCPCCTEEWAQISSTLVPGQFRMKCTSGRTHPLPLWGRKKRPCTFTGLIEIVSSSQHAACRPKLTQHSSIYFRFLVQRSLNFKGRVPNIQHGSWIPRCWRPPSPRNAARLCVMLVLPVLPVSPLCCWWCGVPRAAGRCTRRRRFQGMAGFCRLCGGIPRCAECYRLEKH